MCISFHTFILFWVRQIEVSVSRIGDTHDSENLSPVSSMSLFQGPLCLSPRKFILMFLIDSPFIYSYHISKSDDRPSTP